MGLLLYSTSKVNKTCASFTGIKSISSISITLNKLYGFIQTFKCQATFCTVWNHWSEILSIYIIDAKLIYLFSIHLIKPIMQRCWPTPLDVPSFHSFVRPLFVSLFPFSFFLTFFCFHFLFNSLSPFLFLFFLFLRRMFRPTRSEETVEQKEQRK